MSTSRHPLKDDEIAHRRVPHVYDIANLEAERGTWWVTWITAATMAIEIGAGWWFNSMALLADGWHMSSHAVALGLSAFAYSTARRHAGDPRYAFGTFKVEVLGGFASALFLLGVAAAMAIASVERLFTPQAIQYREAMWVAVFGLVVNLACALILGGVRHHDHDHDHGHDHEPHQHQGDGDGDIAAPAHRHDLNLRSAYVHVLTDAATSVFAILALAGGWAWGWSWLDPAMGLVGALVVAVWAKDLLTRTSHVLLDREMDHPVVERIRAAVEVQGDRVVDLHVWRVGKQSHACALTVVTRDPHLTPDDVRRRLAAHREVVHSTIEVHKQA